MVWPEGGKMDLVALTPEGRIVMTLYHGKHTYSELKRESGLSDRWLTIKLEELQRKGAVEKSRRFYRLSVEKGPSTYELSLYLAAQARRMADEMAELRGVKMIVLFGSVAGKQATEYSDLDLIIVVSNNEVEDDILAEIPRLESVYHVTIEPLILSEADFLENLRSSEGGIVYGLAQGYEILVGRGGILGRTLKQRTEEIRRTNEYLEEAGVWVRAR